MSYGIEEEHPAIIALLNAMPVSYHPELRKWFKEWIAQVNIRTTLTAEALERGKDDIKAYKKKQVFHDLGMMAMELSAITTERNYWEDYRMYHREPGLGLETTYKSLVIRKRAASEDRNNN